MVRGAVVGNLVSCSMAAYAFARLEFRGKKWMFAAMLVTIMLPIHVVIVPQYILFSQIGWVNTFAPLIVPKFLATDAFFTFLMVQFIRGIPRELDEAARIDGAGRSTRFLKITLPLLSPIIFFNLVLQIIGAFQSFTQAFIVSGGTGGPSDSTMFFTLYLYQRGFGQFDMGYASAMAWVLLVIVGAFTAVNFYASKFWVFYDD